VEEDLRVSPQEEGRGEEEQGCSKRTCSAHVAHQSEGDVDRPQVVGPVPEEVIVTCRRCRERVKDWEGSDPKCAFGDDGRFDGDNWCCATLSVLRHAGVGRAVGSDDHWMMVLPFPESCSERDGVETHAVLHWYKSRGRVQSALAFCSDGTPRPLELVEAERLADHYEHLAPSLDQLAVESSRLIAELAGGEYAIVVAGYRTLSDCAVSVLFNSDFSGDADPNELGRRVYDLLCDEIGRFPNVAKVDGAGGDA